MHKTWSITMSSKVGQFFFEDNFGNLGDNQVHFLFGQNSNRNCLCCERKQTNLKENITLKMQIILLMLKNLSSNYLLPLTIQKGKKIPKNNSCHYIEQDEVLIGSDCIDSYFNALTAL